VRLGIGGSGGWADEAPERPKGEEVPDGATWLAQHDVSKGTLQRSDTPRGAASVISAEERDRAVKQWRKQEPTTPVVEATPDPQVRGGAHGAGAGPQRREGEGREVHDGRGSRSWPQLWSRRR
jgi:hypothetical protein